MSPSVSYAMASFPASQPNGISVDPHLVASDLLSRPPDTIDGLLRLRAYEKDQKPVLANPKSEYGLTDYELFTPRDLHDFSNGAARKFQTLGLGLVTGSKAPVVALLGLSTLDYIINMFALSRLGYAVLILSPRLSIGGYQSLLQTTGCRIIVYANSFEPLARKLGAERCMGIVSRAEYDIPSSEENALGDLSAPIDPNQVAFVLHSSGSTGLPKPIYSTHRTWLENAATGYGLRALLTSPFYHTHGLGTLYRTITNRGTLFLLNPNHPLTSTNLLTVMEEIKPKVVFMVPYALKLLAESPRGIQALTDCEVVSSTGSACPDDLGNLLVNGGVHLVTLYGSTEMGQIMTSKRSPGDDTWHYMRLLPSVKPYVYMKPIDGLAFELVGLDGLKSKNTTNSDDPPNSFHSRDIFLPHPTIPDAFKYIGRLDDRITLVNGEKVLPLPLEGRIRQDSLVREAVVFGTGRDVPGLLLFRSDAARDLSDEDFVKLVWPSIKDANLQAEGFSQIRPDYIIPFGADVEYPRTDKATIIRAQVYREFAAQIDELYNTLADPDEGGLELDLKQVQQYLMTLFEGMGLPLENYHSDFFAAGLDSLQAIQAVAVIKKGLYLGGRSRQLTQDQVFQMQNIAGLADFLDRLRLGNASFDPHENDVQLMEDLIRKYSVFITHERSNVATLRHVVVLTGATGSLGSHILAQLLARNEISTIYCLVRPSGSTDPQSRITSALAQRGLTLPESHGRKIVALQSDLSRPDLGLPPDILQSLQSQITLIIHSAWSVDFNIPLSSQENHIRGTQNLLNLSLSTPQARPARFIFCSSISTVVGNRRSLRIPETVVENLSEVQKTGYAQSKLVAEYIIRNARDTAGADVRILRIGQIVGDMELGIWNPSEAIPLMISTAEKIGLPELSEECSWLHVDTVAAATIDLAFRALESDGGSEGDEIQLLYNIVHPRPFAWSPALLDALRDAGLEFETVKPETWVQRLRSGDQDPRRNPAVKLVGFWREKYGQEGKKGGGGMVRFETRAAERDSVSIREAPDVLKEGLIGKMVGEWRKVWRGWEESQDQ